ncbi:MAG: hypothetical protein AAFX85_01555 [Pseudomonadota bacterium]
MSRYFTWWGALVGAFLATDVFGATLAASPLTVNVAPGDSAEVTVSLELDAAEVASVFEGRFDLLGLGGIANASLTPGGPTWNNVAGNINNGQAIVSLTSGNAAGTRLVATLQVTGVNPGTFDVLLASPTFAAFDIPSPPFTQDVPISNSPGELLARVVVAESVPIPPLAVVLLAGLLLGAVARREALASR